MTEALLDRGPGGSGFGVINTVVVGALVVPVMVVTGNPWCALGMVPGIWLIDRVRPPIWYLLAGERDRVVRTAGWVFIAVGALLPVVVAGKYLDGSWWFWPVALIGAAFMAFFGWFAVVSVVGQSWIRKHLYDYPLIHDWLDRVPLGARYPADEVDRAYAVADRIRGLTELRPRPFMENLYEEVMAELAAFSLGLAMETAAAEEVDTDRMLSLCEFACIAADLATARIPGSRHLPLSQRCVAYRAACLTRADRPEEAAAVGAHSVVLARRLREGPRGWTHARVFFDASTDQADRLRAVGRVAEAERLDAEFRSPDQRAMNGHRASYAGGTRLRVDVDELAGGGPAARSFAGGITVPRLLRVTRRPVIGLVFASLAIVPAMVWSGNYWSALGLIPGAGVAIVLSPFALLVTRNPPPREIALAGAGLILSGIVTTVAAVVAVLWGSLWMWPAAVAGAVSAGLIVWSAVMVEVGITWTTTNLYDYTSVIEPVADGRFDADHIARTRTELLVTVDQVRRAIDLPRPPFVPTYGRPITEAASFLCALAQALRSDDPERALELSETACVAGRKATEGPWGYWYLRDHLSCLTFHADSLTGAGRHAEAVRVGAEAVAVARRLHDETPTSRNAGIAELLAETRNRQAERTAGLE